jgi:hypothetical protein
MGRGLSGIASKPTVHDTERGAADGGNSVRAASIHFFISLFVYMLTEKPKGQL